MNSISIDIGSSTIKIIEVKENKILNKTIFIKETPNQAFEKFVSENKIKLNNIENIYLTGIGANKFENKYNINLTKVEEFEAIAKSGLFLSKKEKAIIASIGTGTAIIYADKEKAKHLGGTGVGAGTLFNLCKEILKIKTIEELRKLCLKGNIENVDLRIKDVTDSKIKTLPPDLTLANFGKLDKNSKKEDIAIGMVNMVFEVIGMIAAFATINVNVKDIVLIGNITTLPHIQEMLKKIEYTHKVKFIIPENAPYAVALGATL